MISKYQPRKAMLFLFLSSLFCVNARAQISPQEQKETQADYRKTIEELCRPPKPTQSMESWEATRDQAFLICKSDLHSFEPTFGGRIARSFQYQYQIGEQFRTVVSGSGSTAQFLENPEHYLNQHSLKFQFSELFWSTSDLDSSIKQIIDERPSLAGKPIQLEMCNSQTEVVRCLAGGESLWKRTLYGLSLTVSLSERQGVQLGAGFAPEGSFADHYGVTGQIDFDPTKIFVTADSWKGAEGALQKIAIVQRVTEKGSVRGVTHKPDNDPQECIQKRDWAGPDKDDCIKRLSEATLGASRNRSRWDDFFELMIPTFKFQRLSQFDFVKSGITLVPAKFPEAALNNYSFTWDFRRLIADRPSRDSAHAAFNSYKPPKPPSENVQTSKKICVTTGTFTNYTVVLDAFAPESCRELASLIGATSYALACTSGTNVTSGDSVALDHSADVPESNECKWTK